MAESPRSRRQVLAAGIAVGALLVTGPRTLTGCSSPAPPALQEPDPLERPAQRAESDVALAQAVAGAYPGLATPAAAFAADRQVHAAALRAELLRARPGTPPPGTPPVGSPPSSAPVIATADQATARDTLAAAVRGAEHEAAELVTVLPGYRAALLASVAACCASHAGLLA